MESITTVESKQLPHTFKKDYFSTRIKLYFTWGTCLIILMVLFSHAPKSRIYLGAVGVVFVMLFDLLTLPKPLVISEEGIEFKNQMIRWDDIRKVDFFIDSYKSRSFAMFDATFSTNQTIRLYLKDGGDPIDILPKEYKEPKLLRSTFESLARSHDIEIFVEDRGA